MRKTIATALAGAALIALSGAAAARSNIDVGISFGYPAPVYVAPPPPVAYYPAPVYVQPAPVYYAPPAYYAAPRYYAPRDRGWHRGWDRGERRHHRDHDR
ncbi:MAG: hypothetical protein JWO70_2756 [Betaproteobacteria bacterium]|nr:hypothetical protein [Betaproteobacteria bacterium]